MQNEDQPNRPPENQGEDKHKCMMLGLSIGICLGVSLGMLVFQNLALGLPIGICLGMAVGAGMDAHRNKGS